MTVLHFIKRKQPLKLFKVSESLNSKHCIKYPGFELTSSTEKEPPSCFTPVKYVLEKASTTCFKVWCRLKMISEAVMSSASLVPHHKTQTFLFPSVTQWEVVEDMLTQTHLKTLHSSSRAFSPSGRRCWWQMSPALTYLSHLYFTSKAVSVHSHTNRADIPQTNKRTRKSI